MLIKAFEDHLIVTTKNKKKSCYDIKTDAREKHLKRKKKKKKKAKKNKSKERKEKVEEKKEKGMELYKFYLIH